MSNSAILKRALARASARIVHRSKRSPDLAAADDGEDIVDDDTEDQDAAADVEAPGDDEADEADVLPDMDPETADPGADVEDDPDDEQFTLEDVLECFFRANDTPSDEQVHAFAGLVGMDYEEFEALVFQKFGEVVRQGVSFSPSEEEPEDDDERVVDDGQGDGPDLEDDDELELQADDGLDVQDDIDMFIVAYMLFNPHPSDEQIHQLAFVVDLTKEDMEQRIYRMLGSFLQYGEDDEDTDVEDDVADDDEDEGDDEDAAEDTDAEDPDAPDEDEGEGKPDDAEADETDKQ